MATSAKTLQTKTQSRVTVEGYPTGSLRFDWTVAALSAIFLIGLFVDGWAHNHGQVDQSFFTLWHAIFYSGFALCGLFLVWNSSRNIRNGYAVQRSLPQGYWLSLVGVFLFAIGGVGDLIWHTLFGIEANVDALLSPTHLLLGSSMALIFSGPLRSAWNRLLPNTAPGWKVIGPVVVSATILMAELMFFTQFTHPLVNPLPAFGAGQTQTPHAELYLMNSDGSTQTRLTINDTGKGYQQPALSPDGSKIAYALNDPQAHTADLYVMNADGSSPVQLTHNTGKDASFAPAWLPDGSKIAYTQMTDGNHFIYFMNTDGSNATPLTTDGNDKSSAMSAAWSPDGKTLVFSNNLNGNYDLYTINADGSGLKALTTSDTHDVFPAFSPDGSKIAYSAFNRGAGVGASTLVMNADGSSPVNITGSELGWNAKWSPDGKRLVFISDRDGSNQVYSMNADGSDVKSLSDNAALNSNEAVFSTDGQKIFFTSQGNSSSSSDDLTLSLGVSSILLQSGLIMGLILLLVRNWRLPFGALTLMLTVSSLLITTQHDTFFVVPAMLFAGLISDVILWRLKPSAVAPGRFYLFAFITPLIIFSAYFATLLLTIGVKWTVHAAGGSIFMGGVVGLFIAFLLLSPFGKSDVKPAPAA